MSWLADLFLLHPKEKTMGIELASETTTPPAAAEPVALEAPCLGTAGALDAETLERHIRARLGPELRHLALRVAAARGRLCDLTAAQVALSTAEDARYYTGADPAVWLRNELCEIGAEIAEAEASERRIQARHKAWSQRVTPLVVAVAELHTQLLNERGVLLGRIDVLKRNGGFSMSAAHHLRQAGLTDAQISSLGTIDPAARDFEKYTARVAEMEPLVTAIEAWNASDRRDHHHLAGLGIDQTLITAAQPVAELVAP